jgi:DNA-directed RNA polymerase specialized sigma24 family protein
LVDSAVVDAALESTAVGRPNFLTTQWGLVATASTQGTTEARAALDGLYRVYCYPVYAFIRRRGYDRQDAQDFFVYLLEKSVLGRADPRRGRFRSFLLGTLDHFLAHGAERARTRKRGGDCQFVYLDDDTAENRYQLAARMTAEKIFEARWAATLIEAALTRLRVELQASGKGRLFEAVQNFLLSGEDASYQQVADRLSLSLGAIKTAIHRMRSRYRALLREEVGRTVATPAEVEDELRCLRAALRG